MSDSQKSKNEEAKRSLMEFLEQRRNFREQVEKEMPQEFSKIAANISDTMKTLEGSLGNRVEQVLASVAHQVVLSLQNHPDDGRAVVTVHDLPEAIIAILAALRSSVAFDRLVMRNAGPTPQQLQVLADKTAEALIGASTATIKELSDQPAIEVKHRDAFKRLITAAIVEFSTQHVNAVTKGNHD